LVANWLAGSVIVQAGVICVLPDRLSGGVLAVSSVILMLWIVPLLSGPSSVSAAYTSPLRDTVT
jgi:hypothetical protein